MYVRACACTCAVYLVGEGLIVEANIPVQELEGQRGEGLIFGRIRYIYICTKMIGIGLQTIPGKNKVVILTIIVSWRNFWL